MASITKDAHQPPKSPFWIACYNGLGSDEKVRRIKRSTKTTDKKLAQKLVDEWEQLEKLAGTGRLTESHCRKVIAEMYERTVGEPLHFRTPREFLTEWVASNWKGAILCEYYNGLRLRDIADLEWSAVDLNARIITVTTRKTRKTLTVPIHPQFAAWLEKQTRYREGSDISNAGR